MFCCSFPKSNMANIIWRIMWLCLLSAAAVSQIVARPDDQSDRDVENNNNYNSNENIEEQWKKIDSKVYEDLLLGSNHNFEGQQQNDYYNTNTNDEQHDYKTTTKKQHQTDDDEHYEAKPASYVSSSYGYNRSNNYKTENYENPTLARVIPQQQEPQRLDQIYNSKNSKSGAESAYEKNDSKTNNKANHTQQVLAYYKFPYDFYKINPRNPNSSFTWSPQSSLLGAGLANNAAFKLVYGEYGRTTKKDAYGHSERKLKYGEPGYLQLTSLPYSNQFYQEGFIRTKRNFAVNNTERILGRMKLSCRTIDADKNPFNATAVSRPYDDPRLAGCHFQLTNANSTGPLFEISVINKSVWAGYVARTFISRRKVGVRERYDSIVDAGIELDKRQNAVNYYLNGYKVWSINSIGAPPPDDGVNNIDLGTVGTPTLINLTEVNFSFGTGKKALDESDPYTSDTTRLVRIMPADSVFYAADSKFYDPEGKRSNIVWGQGDIMKVYKLLIVKTESKQIRQSEALPGVYGSSSATNKI